MALKTPGGFITSSETEETLPKPEVRYVDDVLRADDDSAYLAFIVDRWLRSKRWERCRAVTGRRRIDRWPRSDP